MGVVDEPDTTQHDNAGEADPAPLPPWRFPVPFGRSSATDAMTGIAAPLLAGFSLALLGVVAQAPENFLLPGPALLTLTATTVLMVSCVQLGFRARSYLYSASDVSAWWPDPRPEIVTAALRQQQAGHYLQWIAWSNRARFAYNASVIALALSIALVLAPPTTYAGLPVSAAEGTIRWIASGLAATAAVGELAWGAHDRIRARGRASHATSGGR
jgi:hypothetical protein